MDENSQRMRSPHQQRRLLPPGSLHEMNQSAANTRSNIGSGLMKPGQLGASMSTKPSGIAQPSRPKTANADISRGSVSRVPHAVVKTGVNKHKFSASTSSRVTGISRPAPSSSLASTIGPGAGPQPVTRPQTSFGNYHNIPATVKLKTFSNIRDGEVPGTVLGKRKEIEDWDHDAKNRDLDSIAEVFFSCMKRTGSESLGIKEALEVYKERVKELEEGRDNLNDQNVALRVEVGSMKMKLTAAETTLRDVERNYEIALDDSERQMRIEVENMKQDGQKKIDALMIKHRDEISQLQRQFESEIENGKVLRQQEISQVASQRALDTQRGQLELDNKDKEIGHLRRELQGVREEVDIERAKSKELRQHLETANSNSITLESSIRALKARIEFIESGNQEQSQAFARLDQQLADALAETQLAKEKLRKEETLRRKLHNQVQELKGNIRVFCRVRPSLSEEPANEIAGINFPDESMDCKEISVLGQEERSSLGVVSRKNHAFTFDRVFCPSASNSEVFEDISQLVQSALDGYNVCIFAYGQTGSGKTYTMSSEDGMIPRAVHQIYETAQNLEERGWTYTMEGNFVEVYNENLNDLLGRAEELDKKKHEIRHDMQKCKTTITDITTVTLDSPEKVESILRRAAANRSVAATKANERSSRSHSVFILRLQGENSITGERSEGTLNLVDLAGSERLSHSGATGDRLKETQNINRSLSCLGDVIGALGQGKDGGHIPYRNSKLTYLLQFSLGGNSKTLMFVMVSPSQTHLGETLTSLKFATKVHSTHIGTAKRQSRVKDS